MLIEPLEKRDQAVSALATTIQGKIILPAEEKTTALKSAINEASARIDALEKTLSVLSLAHRRTKVIAVISLLGVIIQFALQVINR